MEERIIDFFTNKLDEEARRELLRELSTDEALRQVFIRYRNLSALVALRHRPGDEAEGQAQYARFAKRKAQVLKRGKMVRLFRYIAAAVLLLAMGMLSKDMWPFFNDHPSIVLNTLHVPAGQRASLTLSDGTEVWLNANSTLTYPTRFGDGERRVSLTGEAFFTVAKDKGVPFIVSTSTIAINVLGTVFNVREDHESQGTQVSLLEGRVEIGLPDETQGKIQLEPHQRLTYQGGMATLTQGIDEQEFLWKDGIIHFEELPLSAIAKKLERMFDVSIDIANPAVADRTYSGKFRTQDGAGEILRIIQQAQRFELIKDATGSRITIR